ncbi:MAG TPA: acyltransferase family protein [Melioribacteraceae bacterium]|nr:acyltransferase family protein [Melioribacteraceae bacterium]
MDIKERRYDIDWLRVIAFYLLILYHVGMIFVPWDFHIKNNTTAEWFETWMAFLSQWRLPLLFLISGMVVYYSLGKRTGGSFLLERTKRLFVPLLFGMLIIVPPQIYFERISNGVHFASYWDFWKTVFNFVPYPLGGSLSWHHLWYVLYVLFYSIIALPLFLYLKNNRSESLRNGLSNFVKRHPNSIYLIIIPLFLIGITLARRFPTTHGFFDDWYNHSISFTLFVYGFFISAIDGLSEAITAKRKQSLILALVPSLFLILFVWGPTFEIFNDRTEEFAFIYRILKWILIPYWLFTFIGYGRILLNKSSSVLTYANESVYPLYILHQTVMIFFGYYIIQWNWGIMPKFILLVFLTFGGSFMIYELLIKRSRILRLLFGMKPAVAKPAFTKFNRTEKNLEVDTGD